MKSLAAPNRMLPCHRKSRGFLHFPEHPQSSPVCTEDTDIGRSRLLKLPVFIVPNAKKKVNKLPLYPSPGISAGGAS
jgi:hypothetical protein